MRHRRLLTIVGDKVVSARSIQRGNGGKGREMAQVVADRKRCAIVYSHRIAVLRDGLNIPMHQEAINK